jgi:prophage antirepressor-like protein
MEIIQKTFNFGITDKSVRMVGTPDEPWFCGKDIAIILGYTDTTSALKKNIDIDDKMPLKSILGIRFQGTTLNKNELITTYINESGLYSLILRSKLKSAKKFKKWVTSEVLPSIRKSGKYQMTQEVNELKSSIEQQELKIHEQDRFINRANIINKELLDFKTMNEKNETVYVMSSKSYSKQGLWKIGKTIQKTANRLSSINTSCPSGENIFIVKEIKTHDSKELEKRCHFILKNLRPTDKKEWFHSSWSKMNKLLDIISENMNEEIDRVNELINEVHSLSYTDNNLYTEGLNMNIFEPKETLTITHETNTIQRSQVIDVSGLTEEEKKSKLKEAINLFIRENMDNMKDFDYDSQKNSTNNKITIDWWEIIENLMKLCSVSSKGKIKSNIWKEQLKKMMATSNCIGKVHWKKS